MQRSTVFSPYAKQLNHRYLGGSAMQRLLTVLVYCCLTRPFEAFDEEEVGQNINMSVHSTAHDPASVVKKAAISNSFDVLQPAMEWSLSYPLS